MKGTWIIAIFLLPYFLLIIVLGGAVGGSSPVAAVSMQPPATEEKMWQYADYASQLGIPWDIVLIVDAIIAYDANLPDIDPNNPLDTALHFSVLLEEEWHWEIVGWETDEDGNEYPIYDWVFKWINTYPCKDAILQYAKWSLVEKTATPQQLFDDVKKTEQSKCTSLKKFVTYFSVDTDYPTILKEKLEVSDENIIKIMDLYNAGYADQWLSPDLLARIEQLLIAFGLRQQNNAAADAPGENLDGLIYHDGQTDVVYYAQNDPRWAGAAYGSDNIGEYGCGPTAMAIVISSLTDTAVAPTEMCKWSVDNGYYIRGGGSLHSLIPNAAKAFGLPVSGCTSREPQRILDALGDGKLVVSIMGEGTFTDSGHFIVLRGVTEDGKIQIADPISTKKTNKSWAYSLILDEAKDSASAGGPFWIVG